MNDLLLLEDNEPFCPEPPEWMSFEAKLEWLRSAPKLQRQGRLEGGVVAMLENYCVAIGLARDMNGYICADGNFVNSRPHPAIKVMMDAMKEAKSIAAEIKFEDKPASGEGETQTPQEAAAAAGWDSTLLN